MTKSTPNNLKLKGKTYSLYTVQKYYPVKARENLLRQLRNTGISYVVKTFDTESEHPDQYIYVYTIKRK